MKKYLAALCAMCLVLLGAALAETDIRLADAGVEAGAGVEVDGSSISIVKGGSYRLTDLEGRDLIRLTRPTADIPAEE